MTPEGFCRVKKAPWYKSEGCPVNTAANDNIDTFVMPPDQFVESTPGPLVFEDFSDEDI